MTAAGDLKYTREVKRVLIEQMENPSDEFVRFFASKVFNGMLTPARREYFSGITKRSFHQVINERINERLKSAMSGAGGASANEEETPEEEYGVIETTPEELEGFYIIKAILRKNVDSNRIIHRDTQSYMGILLDDNNRKPLARLHFNRAQKYLGIFDENRKETRIPIESLDDIYKHANEIRRVLAFYERSADSADVASEEGQENTTNS